MKSGAGYHFSLNDDDKKEGYEKGLIVCEFSDMPGVKAYLHIKDMVTNGFLEEPGFHITATPHNARPEHRKRYDVYLSRENFIDLVETTDWRGGLFISRSKFDRISLGYF